MWAEEIADELCIPKIIHAPEVEQWDPKGRYGYKARNLDIARDSETLHVIVAATYPPDFPDKRFDLCFHCARIPGRDMRDHVRSGACWTANKAIEGGKRAVWHIVGDTATKTQVVG